MKVGDLVKYRYGQQDVGIIIEIEQEIEERSPKFKVLWATWRDAHGSSTDWMRPTGLEVIGANR